MRKGHVNDGLTLDRDNRGKNVLPILPQLETTQDLMPISLNLSKWEGHLSKADIRKETCHFQFKIGKVFILLVTPSIQNDRKAKTSPRLSLSSTLQ